MERYQPNYKTGLTNEEVKHQIENNLVNFDTEVKTKTIGQIISSNVFTLFNMLNSIILLAVLVVGSYKNALFFGVVICNTIISTIQEINSKRVIDKLKLINHKEVTLIRDSKEVKKNINEIVLDDVMVLKPGNQVVTDTIVINGECEVNESLITGEPNNIHKKVGDMILSGTFVVSGFVYTKVENIGEDNFTAKITKEAKYIKKNNSVLMKSLNKIIKTIAIFILPLGVIFFFKQYSLPDITMNEAIIRTCAAMIGMIPEGLILLTSTVLAVSIIKLAKFNVLVQQLFCIEALARVDMMCLDKTGTLTEGTMTLEKIIALDEKVDLEEILSHFTYHLKDENATIEAIRSKYYKVEDKKTKTYPFSSEHKYSALEYEDKTYILGAPSFIYSKSLKEVEDNSEEYRVLLFGSGEIKNNKVKNLKPLGVILLRDKIRKEAKQTLEYFASQGVQVKIISGDSGLSVSTIASRVGMKDNKYIDITDKDDLEYALTHYNIFGRVTPNLKKKIILKLKELGHTVGMVGDGINDILALKEADCSVALASGSDAAKSVSELVLLDNNFDSLPHVVHEGRRTVNNIERSATLFLIKTSYTFLLVLIFMFMNSSYPFIPIQLTLTSTLTIGIPAFILSLEPNKDKIKGNFLVKVFTNAVPPALIIVLNVLFLKSLDDVLLITDAQSSTLAVILSGYIGFLVLYLLCEPFNKLRKWLFGSLVTLFIVQVVWFKNLFSLTFLNLKMLILLLLIMIVDIFLYRLFVVYFKKKIENRIYGNK